MGQKNLFRSPRADTGIERRIVEEWREAPQGDWSFTYEGVANWALARYDTRIRAKLRKLGLDMPEQGALTVESIKALIHDRTGLDVQSVTPAGIMAAFDAQLARELSSRLGLEVSTVFNGVALKAQVKAAMIDKITTGKGGKLVGDKAMHELRAAATIARAGLTRAEARKALLRYYQKRYRRGHVLQWV